MPRTHIVQNRKLMNIVLLSDKTLDKTVTCNTLKGRLHAHRSCSLVVSAHCLLLSGKPWEKDEVKLELANQQQEMAGNSLCMEVPRRQTLGSWENEKYLENVF